MNAQISIWEKINPRARNTDPETSHKAAERSYRFSHSHNKLILDALSKAEMTGREMQSFTGLTNVQICRRTSELFSNDLIENIVIQPEHFDSDNIFRKAQYLTRAGCRVWRRV